MLKHDESGTTTETKIMIGRKMDGVKELPFKLPQNQQLFGYFQWTEARRKLKKTSGKLPRQSKRSLVGNEIFQEFAGPMAITDIDPGFFTDINGRPIRDKFSSRRYVEQTRLTLRAKLIAGYYRDECMRIDQQFSTQKKKLIEIEADHRKYTKAFEKYLSNDHEESMRVLDEAQIEAKKTNDLIAKRDQLSKEFGQVRLEIYQWEEMWRVAKACYDFVNKISPKAQRTSVNESSSEVSGRNQKNSTDPSNEQASLETLIETFEKDIQNLGSNEICLKDPRELSQIFSDMELRNLDALIHLESLAGPMDDISTSMAQAEELVGKEIENIEESLQELRAQIDISEKRATNLEKYADYLLHKVFKQLVCSEPVLHLRVFIEDAYESCIGPNDASLDGYTMMRTIEKTYEKLNMTLDNLPHNIVRVCEKEGFTQEMRAIREAEDAARKFDLMHRLLAALERIMEPTKVDPKAKLKFRSILKRRRVKKPPQSSSKGQRKTRPLLFFSDECGSEDSEWANEQNFEEIKKQSELGRENQVLDNNFDDCREKML